MTSQRAAETNVAETNGYSDSNPQPGSAPGEIEVTRTIYADVVAIDQPFMINRLGASQPAGMIFVLKEDLVGQDGNPPTKDYFRLREGKRPRPIVLRMNVGDVLQINFSNWLKTLNSQAPDLTQQLAPRPFFVQKTRYAGIHVNGLELVGSIQSDGTWVGKNSGEDKRGVVAPGELITYKLYARNTGTFLMSSGADTTVHQLNAGMFGAVNVQPRNAEYYRSQTTRRQMHAATIRKTPEDAGLADMTNASQRADEMTIQQYNPNQELSLKEKIAGMPRETVDPYDPTGKKKRELEILRSVDPSRRAEVYRPVYVDQERYVYSAQGQPLINYHAVYDDPSTYKYKIQAARKDKPVLSMLEAVKGGKLQKSGKPYELKKSNYEREIQQLSAGFIPPQLRPVFKRQTGRNLTLEATVARAPNRNPYTWVLTDRGQTYLMQGSPPDPKAPDSNGTLEFFACQLKLVYSDLTAIITGPNARGFSFGQEGPEFYDNPASPDRRQPYREMTIIYHQGGNIVQAFRQWSNNNLFRMINAGLDQFGINYGFAAIGPEIVANRLDVGPMGNRQQGFDPAEPGKPGTNDNVELKYEEFFLSSWCVGDPSMVVDVPANAQNQYVSNPDGSDNKQKPGEGNAIIGEIENNPVQFENFKPLVGQTGQEKFPNPNAYPNRPSKAFYPDDPSNVYHSYARDHMKMRVLHSGPGPAHVHHLHAHQWLHSPNSPEGHYLDSQLIIPGTGYTLEIAYNGSGNRNQTIGDSIFHCHFYPHFAKGMWALWRVHDTFEEGTWLDDQGICVTKVHPTTGHPVPPVAGGKPNPDYDDPTLVRVANRALPDGEIASGSPTPAVIPLPTLGMAPMPGEFMLTDLQPWYPAGVGMGRRVKVLPEEDGAIKNPGYPFFVPGIGGHRAPHPPLDMAWLERDEEKNGQMSRRVKQFWTAEKIESQLGLDPLNSAVQPGELQYLDGGLPRHLVLGGNIVAKYQTRWDFTKEFYKELKDHQEFGGLFAYQLPEEGTPVEKAAMKWNATRSHETSLPNGHAGTFTLNGLPPNHGAPYAEPGVSDDGNSVGHPRRYQAAVIQTDVVLNKKGWHYPQQRFITLWEDVQSTIDEVRPPQPFFIRTATGDTTEFWHTNLVPNYYELDDFQVRTPTDVIGQHIHLVKFDVTASDGAANGFNYEDGTFGPEEVQERIKAIMKTGGLYAFDSATGFVDKSKQRQVAVWKNKYAYPPRTAADGKMIGTKEAGLFGPPPAGQTWDGAMTTIQRWDIDPLLNWQGHDRTLRTVFTHDHFSPSTHQQVGLYAGVLVEPAGSQWYLPDGQPMNTREDGGPTSWQAVIVKEGAQDAYREYAFEFQDMQLAYTADSLKDPSNALFKPELLPRAVTKLDETIRKEYGDEGFKYDGNVPLAPSAFYIGQATKAEADTVSQLILVLNQNKLPPIFPELFLRYGIQLSPGAKATVIDPGQGAENGFLNAFWVITQPPAGDDVLNGGDYYLVRATNPISTENEIGPSALSVYTPVIHAGYADPEHAVNPNSGGNTIAFDDAGGKFYNGNIGTPTGAPQQIGSPTYPDPARFGNGAPYASLVSTRSNGTYSLNYRNEPAQLRKHLANKSGVKPWNDLAYLYSSPKMQPVKPPDGAPALTTQPAPQLLEPYIDGGPQRTDPFTPLIRGYPGDKIQIRTLVGAHLQPHAFTVHGNKWLFEPSYQNSGWRNVQGMGISEHFEMLFQLPTELNPETDTADYFYSASTGAVGLSNGLWGIMRVYGHQVGDPPDYDEPWPDPWKTNYLMPLVNNATPDFQPRKHEPIDFQKQFELAKAAGDPTREYTVFAGTAKLLTGNDLVYNTRDAMFKDPNAVMFVRMDDLADTGRLKPELNIEPLILRAAAGEWIKITLSNSLSANTNVPPFNQPQEFWYGNPFNGLTEHQDLQKVPMFLSRRAGLHPQLVAYDATRANGLNVGTNPDNTAAPGGGSIDYYWFAGDFQRDRNGNIIRDVTGKVATVPIEFGATNLVGADLILQTQFGMVGALIIEPKDSKWSNEPEEMPNGNKMRTHAFKTITDSKGRTLFRECVLVMQNMVSNITPGREATVAQTASRQRGFGAVNYRTENFAVRDFKLSSAFPPPPEFKPDKGYAEVFSNSLELSDGNPIGDPQTPVFYAEPGDRVRFRVVMPSTTSANSAAQPLVIAVHGHGWQSEPYINNGTRIGNNLMSETTGAQKVTVTQKYDFVIDSAGGAFGVEGDYQYQAFNQEQKIGVWGLFRVQKKPW